MAGINATIVDPSFMYVYKLEVTRWAVFTLWLAIFLIGVPGNLMIVAVYWASGITTSTHMFIGSLAVADLLMCLLKFADAIAIASAPSYLAYNRVSSVYFLSAGLLYSTALLTTAISFDRFDAVCRALRRSMTLRRAKIVSALCFIVGFVGLIPELVLKIQTDPYGEVNTFDQSIVRAIPLSIYVISLLFVIVLYSGIFVFLRKRGQVESREVPTIRHGVGLSVAGASFTGGEEERAASTADDDALHARDPGRAGAALRLPDVSEAPLTSADNSQQAYGIASISEHHPSGTGDRRNDPPRRDRRRHGANQSRITRMLLITTFMFFFLWFPFVYLKVYALGTLFTDFTKSHHHANLVSALLVLRDIAFFNSVINVFIYSVANRRFLLESKRVVKNIRARLG